MAAVRGSRLGKLNPGFRAKGKSTTAAGDLGHELAASTVRKARETGELKLSAHGFAHIPDKVWRIEAFDDDELRHLEVKFDVDDAAKWWEPTPLTRLDLSANSIQCVPPKIKQLASLTHLNLNGNSLAVLPDELGCLACLTHLNVSRNRLTSLPRGLYDLRELTSLEASHNSLDTLDAELGSLIMLQKLDVSANSLSDLPPGVGFLARLTEFSAAHNQLTEIPPDLAYLRVLTRLDLSHNALTELPPLGELRKLEVLTLHHNQLTSLPDLAGCKALKDVYLGFNNITELDADLLDAMQSVKVLDCERNSIAAIPPQIQHLRQLTRLNLNNNAIAILPGCLAALPHLQSLQVSDNPVTNVRRDVIACGTQRLVKFLRQMEDGTTETSPAPANEMAAGDDRAFPDKWTMRSSQALNLANQGLQSVPERVIEEAMAAGVVSVDLAKNQLSVVPDRLAHLTDITELNLSFNRLTQFPGSVANCGRLQYLDLQNNSLDSLPEELATLLRLRELNIAFNRFTALPGCVYQQVGLEILVASDNRLTGIDVTSLGRLPRLTVLDLRNNDISVVPPRLGEIETIRTLELSGNSFRTPTHAHLSKGTEFLMAYLRDRVQK